MTMMDTAPLDALVLAAWSCVWSPIVPRALFEQSWLALDLPDDASLRDTEFCSAFHAGFPAPATALLLHAALHRSSDESRTDMLRAMSHMGMRFGDHVLAPDHLAIACEVAAVALAQEEPVIAGSLLNRYLIPWCGAVRAQLDDNDTGLRRVVERFLSDCERTSELIGERTGPPMHISKTNACSAQNHRPSR